MAWLGSTKFGQAIEGVNGGSTWFTMLGLPQSQSGITGGSLLGL
jgi:hypothetical protein